MNEINTMITKIKQFRDDRDWLQFHDPKNMAISIMLEASELLEHFQWKTKEEVDAYIANHRESVQEEIADIAMYLFELSDNLGIDLIAAMEKKLKKNAVKYPVDKVKGSHKKYNQL
ncbi:MAG: nucleotide pyrophosphohydrolase [Candidatus Omnitrophica bacterium]|nr:nucleotide pyrophosphohydrolase [Candidatus Omnitrophota bacterium]